MMKRALAMAAFCLLAVMAMLWAPGQAAHAQATASIASDRAAGLIIFPKIVSDPSDIFASGRATDTAVEITNDSATTRSVHCVWVDATSHCSNGPNAADPLAGACRTSADCLPGGTCLPGWNPLDTTFDMSPNQTVGFTASGGIQPQMVGIIPKINPVPELFFVGELKCFEVASSATLTSPPIAANDLKGVATIESVTTGTPGSVDARSYNAIGVQAVLGCVGGTAPAGQQCTTNTQCGGGFCVTNGASLLHCNSGMDIGQLCATDADCGGAMGSCGLPDEVLCLGGTTGSSTCPVGDFAQCPSTLILNNFFDSPGPGGVTTDLTLVPCSEDLAGQLANQTPTTVQIVVFNEFEQRFSASLAVDCFKEIQLSHIDARVGQETSSIFNVAVEGTLVGQTRIRPVVTNDTTTGHGVLAVAEEFHTDDSGHFGSAAFNLNYVGLNAGHGDFITP